jgi:iron complex transport system substrate-binding protein
VPRKILAFAIALTVIAACGGDDEPSGGAAATTTAADAAAPERIVSLSPTATEMLFAIDAGGQVVAVDDNSNYPSEAPASDLSGLEPNVEAIIGYEPDLVVLSEDPGDVEAGLEAADVETLLLPAATTLDDTYQQIEQLGEVTGHAPEADELVASMRGEIDDLVASLPDSEGSAPTYYHELDPTFFTATSSTFIGDVYSLAGLENIADAADTDASGYPQLSAEYVLEQDPDLIFLADTNCCQQSAETVAARPGWSDLSAVRQDNVVELDDDIASRWGPRVVDLLETVIDAVNRVPAG